MKLSSDYVIERGCPVVEGDKYLSEGLVFTVVTDEIKDDFDLDMFSFAHRTNNGKQPVPDDFPVIVEWDDGINEKCISIRVCWDDSMCPHNILSWKPDREKLIEQQAEYDTQRLDVMKNNINETTAHCHELARSSGWWDDADIKDPMFVPAKLCLIHSEVSEAMEGARKDLMDDHLPNRKMLEVELADTVIRIMDLAGGLGLDLGGAMEEKLEYNKTRADHKRENRSAENGKAF